MWVFQLCYDPVIERSVILEFQCTDRMCDTLNRIFNRMCEIVHRINAPLITCSVMCHMSPTVNDRISHVHVRRCHVDSCTQYLLAICEFTILHIFKKCKVLFYASVAGWIFLTWLSQCTTVFTDLICCQVRYICLTLLDQLHCAFIHLVKIIGCKEQSVFPVCAKPCDICFDGFDEFYLLLCRIGIIKTHVELTAIFLGKSIIQNNALRMSDMQISVWFRWESGVNCVIYTLCKVLIYNLFNKILGNDFFFLTFCFHILI